MAATSANVLEGQNAPAGREGPVGQILAGLAEAFRGIREAAADRSIMSTFVSFVLALGGFGAFSLGWRGAAATLSVGVQLPFLLSGGAAGFALMGFGLGVWHTQM